MTRPADVTERYVADFKAFAGNGAAGAPVWLKEIREAAIARFAEMGFPSMKQEAWRFTSTAPIAETPFALAGRAGGAPAAELQVLFLAGPRAARAVFVDGRFAPDLSTLTSLPPGVRAGSLARRSQRPRPDVHLALRPLRDERIPALSRVLADER
jgi:Fe-S cluster assembly protein SufD